MIAIAADAAVWELRQAVDHEGDIGRHFDLLANDWSEHFPMSQCCSASSIGRFHLLFLLRRGRLRGALLRLLDFLLLGVVALGHD